LRTKIYNFLQILPHDAIAFIACATVIVGMYVSRAMMSMGMIALLANAILNVQLGANLKRFLTKTHLLLITGYVLLLSVSFFWSSDKVFFNERFQIMIPFLILPFSFFSISRWEMKWYDILILLFIILNLGGIGWSMGQYLQQKDTYDIGYGFSKLIPTPFEDDHIRFSLAVVMSICFCVDLFSRYKNMWFKVVLVLIVFIDILYIHILSAKTGILAFYLVTCLFVIYMLFSLEYKRIGIIILLCCMTLPFVMYTLFPSFKNKIGYVRYTFDQMGNTEKQAYVSDEGRLISYEYALESIRKYPLIGVGLGDVYQEMAVRYDKDFKGQHIKVLLPHNQFLMVGMAVGVFGMVYLIVMLFFILKIVRKNDFLYFSFCLIMLMTMMIEPLFETQFGTCIFLFFLLFLMKRSKYYLA
jgi:O-antigen ligase